MTQLDISPLMGGNLTATLDVPDELSVMQDGDKPQLNFHIFRILHPKKGDDRVTWDSRDFSQIRAAKAMFLDLIKKGLKPFRVGVDGKPSAEEMKEFDPLAEEIVFLPFRLVQGG